MTDYDWDFIIGDLDNLVEDIKDWMLPPYRLFGWLYPEWVKDKQKERETK
jgi:hypothetical protein